MNLYLIIIIVDKITRLGTVLDSSHSFFWENLWQNPREIGRKEKELIWSRFAQKLQHFF